MKKLKILIYSHLFPNNMEPMKGIFVLERVRFLKQYCEIKVVAPIPYFPKIKFFKRWNKFSQIPKKEIIEGVEVFHPRFIHFPKRIFRKYIGYWMYLLSKKLLRRIYTEWKFDLIHAHFIIYSGQAVYNFCKGKSIPYLLTEHYSKISLDLSKESIYRNIYEKVFFNSQKIIVVSERLNQTIKSNFPNLNKIKYLPNGVDIGKFVFHEKSIDKNNPKLISIGNLVETKGYQYLIEAVKILREKNILCHLNIIGEGKFRKNLETIIADNSLQNQIELVGYVPNNEIQKYFDQADIYVHPSLFESFGVVVIEAMSTGKPVVVTKSGGPEYIVPDEFGIKVQKENSEELASALENMISNYESYNQKKISDYIKNTFSYDIISKQIYQVYDEISR